MKRRNSAWLVYLGFGLAALWLVGKAGEAARKAFAHPRYRREAPSWP